MTGCNRSAFVPARPLVQIRLGVATEYAGLDLSVEVDEGGWLVRVRGGNDGRTLYRGQRCSLGAGKIAAAEFAALRANAPAAWSSPESIALHLDWKPYW